MGSCKPRCTQTSRMDRTQDLKMEEYAYCNHNVFKITLYTRILKKIITIIGFLQSGVIAELLKGS